MTRPILAMIDDKIWLNDDGGWWPRCVATTRRRTRCLGHDPTRGSYVWARMASRHGLISVAFPSAEPERIHAQRCDLHYEHPDIDDHVVPSWHHFSAERHTHLITPLTDEWIAT